MYGFILIIVCLDIFVAAVGNTQDRITSLSLDEAVALATRDNFTLRAAQFEYQATRTNEVTAGLVPNPSFSYLGEQLNEGSNVQQYTVAVGQIVETGGKRQGRLDSARAATQVAGHSLTGVERQVLFQVKKSFTDVLTAKLALVCPREAIQVWPRTGRWHSSGEMIRTHTEHLICSLSNAMR